MLPNREPSIRVRMRPVPQGRFPPQAHWAACGSANTPSSTPPAPAGRKTSLSRRILACALKIVPFDTHVTFIYLQLGCIFQAQKK